MERLPEGAREEDPEEQDQKGEKGRQNPHGDGEHQRMGMPEEVEEIPCGKHRGEREEEDGGEPKSGAGTHSDAEE